jgi:hypothetical protein
MREIEMTDRPKTLPPWPRWKKILAYLIFSIAATVAIALVDWKVHLFQ